MTASDQNNRRADRAELARHIAAVETVAFMTALVGLLNEAEAGEHRGDRGHHLLPLEPSRTSAHPADATPAVFTDEPRHGDQHADAADAASGNVSPPLHVDAAPATGHPQDSATTIDTAAATTTEGHVAAPDTVQTPVPGLAAPGHVDLAATGTAHGDATISSPVDTTPTLQQLGTAITQFVDASLATVSHTIESLAATVSHTIDSLSATTAQLTSSLTGALGGIVNDLTGSLLGDGLGGVTHAVTDLLHTSVTSSLQTSGSDTHAATATGSGDFAAGAHDGGMFDTAGAIPISELHPISLHLSFLGQPTTDGHEMHDGAFSALGIHHF